MVHCGLGAVPTAGIRHKTAESIGPFDAGNPKRYGWTGARLPRHGSECNNQALMRGLLRRPPSSKAVLAEIRRIQ